MVLRVALVQPVSPLQVLLAILRAGESELPRAQSLRVQMASRPAAPLQALEPAPWVPLEQRRQALPGRSASPPE
jgi:hypothetical protein